MYINLINACKTLSCVQTTCIPWTTPMHASKRYKRDCEFNNDLHSCYTITGHTKAFILVARQNCQSSMKSYKLCCVVYKYHCTAGFYKSSSSASTFYNSSDSSQRQYSRDHVDFVECSVCFVLGSCCCSCTNQERITM